MQLYNMKRQNPKSFVGTQIQIEYVQGYTWILTENLSIQVFLCGTLCGNSAKLCGKTRLSKKVFTLY